MSVALKLRELGLEPNLLTRPTWLLALWVFSECIFLNTFSQKIGAWIGKVSQYFSGNVKTLDRLLFSVLFFGSYKLYHKALPFPLWRTLGYSPSNLDYLTHLAIVMFMRDQFRYRIHWNHTWLLFLVNLFTIQEKGIFDKITFHHFREKLDCEKLLVPRLSSANLSSNNWYSIRKPYKNKFWC